MHVQQTICRLKVRDLVVLVTLFMLWVSPRIGLSQQPSIVQSQGAPAAATSTPESEGKASLAIPMISVQPRLQAPIHVVPFREPGPVTTKLNFFPAGAHVEYFGGPVISSVHVVLVLYGPGAYLPNIAGTTTPSMANFYNDITKSTFFDMLSEYSTVGIAAADGTAGTNQIIGHGFFDGQFTITPAAANNGATITDNQIQAELLSQVNAGNLPAPALDIQGNSNTLYMIFFPPGKSITAGGSTSCVRGGFCAYHNSTNASFGTHRLYYGVMPDLQPPSGCSTGCGSGTTFDMATNVTSHELSEAVTDADVGPATAFARPLAWMDRVNGEIGDICVGQEASVLANGTTYTVQQEFSNFQNDCVSGPPQLFVPAGNTVTPGQKFDLQVTAQNSNGANITTYAGTVHFTSSDPNASLPPDYTFVSGDFGSHIFVVSLGTVGSQTITVSDTKLPQLVALDRPFTVVASTVSRFSIAEPGNVTQSSPFSITVAARDSDGNVVPNYAGTLHFTSGDPAAVLPADTTLTNGVGNFTVKFGTAGVQTMVATDIANGQLFGSASNNVFATSANPTATTVASNANPSTFLQTVTYTATVTQGGAAANVGTVTFTSDGVPFGSAFVDGLGHAQVQILNLPGGNHVIFADYVGGDAAHPPSSSAPLNVTVNPAPTTAAVSSNLSPSIFGTSLILTAQISTLPGNVANGGTVTFFDGAAPMAIIGLGGGTAFTNGSSLSVGTHNITVSYSGTSGFQASTSAPFVQVITPVPNPDYSVVPDKTSATLLAGQAATFNITTTSVNGFTGSVSFSCGNLPALTTCTISPSPVSVSSGSTINTVLTVKTTGPHAALIASRTSPSRSVYAMLWTLSPFTLGIVFIIGRKRNLRRAGMFIGLAVLFIVAGLTSCGGGSTPPPPVPQTTPAGVATFTVTAKGTATAGSGPANPSQQLNITITVQP